MEVLVWISLPLSSSFNLASVEHVKGFSKRPLPSEFSSSLCTYLGKLQKRLGLGDLSCVGGVDWESQTSELPRFRAPGYLLHKNSGPRG